MKIMYCVALLRVLYRSRTHFIGKHFIGKPFIRKPFIGKPFILWNIYNLRTTETDVVILFSVMI